MNSWKTAAIALATILILLVPSLPLFEVGALPMDEGALLLYPELMTKGKLPYRDFETFYGPGNLMFMQGVYAVFGSSLTVERTVGLAYRIAIFAAVFAFALRWGLTAAVASTLVAGLTSFIMTLTALAWLGGLAALLWCVLLLAGPPSSWRVMLAGLLGGVAVLYRQDLALALILAAVPLGLLLTARLRWIFVGGLLVGVMPYVIYAAMVGWRPLLDNLFIYPVFITSAGRKLPLLFTYPGAGWLVVMHAVACVVNLAVAVWAVMRDRQSREARLLLAMTLVAVGLTHQGLQRADPVHTSLSVFLSLALVPVCVAVVARNMTSRVWRIALPALSAGVILWLTAVGYPATWRAVSGAVQMAFSSDLPTSRELKVRDRTFRYGSAANPPPTRVLTLLEQKSKPGERLFVGGGDLRLSFATHTWIYYLTPWLEPATYFLEMNPLSANRENSRLADDVASADWLVLDQRWDRPNEPNRSSQPGPDRPNQVVHEQFEQVLSYNSYRVFRRKGALD